MTKFKLQKIYSSGSGKINEDDLLVTGNLFAVFDGATSLIGFKGKGGLTGGKLAARVAKSAFTMNSKPLRQLGLRANSKLLKVMKEAGVDTKQKIALWATSVAAVRLLADDNLEFFSIGDSLILAIFKNGSYKLLAPYHDHDLETLVKWKRLASRKVKDIRGELRQQLNKVRVKANVNYGVLNGEKSAVRFIKSGVFSLRNVKSIVLFTDGLFIPKKSPTAPEPWDAFVRIYVKFGLRGLLKRIRSVEKSDLRCWKFPRLKPHDDIAAIGIDFL